MSAKKNSANRNRLYQFLQARRRRNPAHDAMIATLRLVAESSKKEVEKGLRILRK